VPQLRQHERLQLTQATTQGVYRMPKEQTGKKAASNAGKVLSNKRQDKPSKSAAGSALTQRESKPSKKRK
jgi:hypothetical protein